MTSGAAFLEALKQELIDPQKRRQQLYDALGLKTPKTADELEREVESAKKILDVLTPRERGVMQKFIDEMTIAIRQLRILEEIEGDSRGDGPPPSEP